MITRCRAPRLSGPTFTRWTLPSRSPSAPSGSRSSPVGRQLVRNAIRRSSPMRRSANSSAPRDEGSSHWMSSIATRTGFRRESSRRYESTAAAIVCAGGGEPPGSASRSAASRACRCGSGSSGRTSAAVPRNRSARPANGSSSSGLVGRATRTRHEPALASATPSRHSVVFPIPASPASTSAAGPTCSRPSRNDSIALSSGSRPTSSGCGVCTAVGGA